jgi:hypothetical protein
MSKLGPGPIDVGDVDRIFNTENVDALAVLLHVSDLNRAQFQKLVREDARIFALSAHAPDVNDLRKQIAKLEDAGRAYDAHVVGLLLDQLYPTNKQKLEPRWARMRPGVAFPSSRDISPDRADEICMLVASICRGGGQYIERHLRQNGKKSLEWETVLRAPPPNRNVQKVWAERELVRNLRLTWHEITNQPAPDVVHRDCTAPFAKFVALFFKLVGSKASVVKQINEIGEQRRLPLFAEAAIWRWRAPSEQWSALPQRLGDWRRIKQRFDKWQEKDACKRRFVEMEAEGRSDGAIALAIVQITRDVAANRKSASKKNQRKQLKKRENLR